MGSDGICKHLHLPCYTHPFWVHNIIVPVLFCLSRVKNEHLFVGSDCVKLKQCWQTWHSYMCVGKKRNFLQSVAIFQATTPDW